MANDGISVVLPVRNGMPFLADQVSAVLAQEVAVPFELVVVENDSSDGTAEFLRLRSKTDARIRVISLSQAGACRARNAGIAAARHDAIALCDSDDLVHPGWLEAHRSALAGRVFGGGAIVRGALNSAAERRRWGISELAAEVPVVSPFGGESPLSANASLDRRMWQECGGFDERIIVGGDESEFFARCGLRGWSMVKVPEAVIDYRLVSGSLLVLRKSYRYGRSNERIHQTVKQRRSVRWRLYVIREILRNVPGVLQGFGRYQRLEAVGYEFGRLVGSVRPGLASPDVDPSNAT